MNGTKRNFNEQENHEKFGDENNGENSLPVEHVRPKKVRPTLSENNEENETQIIDEESETSSGRF